MRGYVDTGNISISYDYEEVIDEDVRGAHIAHIRTIFFYVYEECSFDDVYEVMENCISKKILRSTLSYLISLDALNLEEGIYSGNF